MWVSGSLISSSTWRSSSVSAPRMSSSICLPSSPERSRTMRGSFCHALPIGCMRVFMTPSCSSAVTLDRRCSGTLNSELSCRRAISSSWLRVSTSSETIVIRCSSVSTFTRSVWLAILPSVFSSSAPPAGFSGAGFSAAGFAAFAAGAGGGGGAAGAGAAVSRGTPRSSSSSGTSPRRKGRSSTRKASVPAVGAGAAAAGAAGSGAAGAAAMAAAASMTMRSSCADEIAPDREPAGSCCAFSSWPRISLMRSMVERMIVTASPVTGMPSRNFPISVSAACASASSRGRPMNPQVPLIVCTMRKILARIFALLGSCSKCTSSTSTVSRLSPVSVRNSRSKSSI